MDAWVLDHLDVAIKAYLARQETMFVASSDRHGACHGALEAGPPGFVRVLDDRTLMYPQYGSDDCVAGGHEIGEQPSVGLLFVAAFRGGQGLHLSGRGRIIEHGAVEAFAPLLRRMSGIDQIDDVVDGCRRTPERWVMVEVAEARSGSVGSLPNVASPPLPDPVPAAASVVDDDELSYLLPPAWSDA